MNFSAILIFFFYSALAADDVTTDDIITQLDRPIIIAHRGSSGMLPEHTVEAYQLAIKQGADVIECDIVFTKDRQMICRHDPWLSDSTDVTSHLEFEDRRRTYTIDGVTRNDFFSFDFTLAEIKTLKAVQSWEFRDSSFNTLFEIATFDQFMEAAFNGSKGIYPELKFPTFFNNLFNISVEELFIDHVTSSQYHQNNIFIQSFDLKSLEALSKLTDAPLVYLMKSSPPTDRLLRHLSTFCYGVGVSKNDIITVDNVTNHVTGKTSLVSRCHSFGLKVHAFTFRNENQFLAFDFGADPYMEISRFIEADIDGFFTDFPATLNNFMMTSRQAYVINEASTKVTSLIAFISSWLVLTAV